MAVPQVAIDAVTHYLQKGIARGPAIGIVSVCYAGESQLNPGPQPATGSTDTGGVLFGGGAFGIASWNGPRQAALQAFATAKGESPTAVNTQLDFILTECANSYSNVWAAIQSGMAYTPFITLFVTQYEGPANPSAEISRSVAFAQTLDAAVPQVVAPVPTPTPAPKPTPVPIPAPAPTGASTLNPFLLALIDAVVASLVKEVIAQTGVALPVTVTGTTTPTTGTTPPVVSLDPTTIVTSIVTPLIAQLTGALPGLIAAELAKIIPTTTVKSS
jgi:hypothetical protein